MKIFIENLLKLENAITRIFLNYCSQAEARASKNQSLTQYLVQGNAIKRPSEKKEIVKDHVEKKLKQTKLQFVQDKNCSR